MNKLLTKFQNRREGFTIVELLIVIVVIGILAAITIISYTGITTQANINTAKANAQAILDASTQYYNLAGNYPYVNAGTLSAASGSASALVSNGVTVSVPTSVTVTSTKLASDSTTQVLYVRTSGGDGACVAYRAGSSTGYAIAGAAASSNNYASINATTPACS